MSGTTVGPYTVLRELGRGGMGRVLLCAGPDGTRVAVKVIRSDLAGDAQFRRRFRREIDAARLVPPRWTARVLDADPDAEQPWVATEFVAGPSLEQHVREHGPLTGRALRRLAVSLFGALVALGRAGLVHRDLKPSNVLLDGGDPARVRVVDFGIARAADDTRMTSTGAVLGTPAYMAPEQAIGDDEVGPPADVHAVGAMLVFAATGSPPYAAASAAAVLYRKLHGEPQLGDTPEPERGWAARCLARDPSERPDPARLLAESRRPGFLRGSGAAGTDRAQDPGSALPEGPPQLGSSPGGLSQPGSAPEGPPRYGSGAARRRPPYRRGAVVAVATLLLLAGGATAVVIGVLPGDPAASGSSGGGASASAGPTDTSALDASVPGNGPAVTSPPATPATVDGPVVALRHRAGRIVAGVGRVYVADPDGGAVTVLDAQGRDVGTVEVGRFPSALALSPDGSRLYATLNTSPTRLVAVDTASLRVTGTADLAPDAAGGDVVFPADLAVAPDGRTVVVLDPRSSRVVAVDAATLRPGARSAAGPRPRALAITPDGGRVLVSGGTEGEATGVSVLALPGLTPLATAPGVADTADLAVDPGGARAYLAVDVASADQGLRVLDAGDGRVRATVTDPGSATRLVAGAGGRWLYVVGSPADELSVVDTSATTPRVVDRKDTGGDQPEDAAVSPDGRALYVAAGRTVRILTIT